MSGLPGRILSERIFEGTICEEEGCGSLATKAIQGETDSMGHETMFLCDGCHEELKDSTSNGTCEWCNTANVELQAARDMDEGNHGPVYEICSSCSSKQNQRIAEEMDYYDD